MGSVEIKGKGAIELVEIQGHTDNRGSSQVNQELYQRRAREVKLWLVDHGVDPSRLVAKGYGSSRPLVPNITPYNRALNRRVHFRIQRRVESTADASSPR